MCNFNFHCILNGKWWIYTWWLIVILYLAIYKADIISTSTCMHMILQTVSQWYVHVHTLNITVLTHRNSWKHCEVNFYWLSLHKPMSNSPLPLVLHRDTISTVLTQIDKEFSLMNPFRMVKSYTYRIHAESSLQEHDTTVGHRVIHTTVHSEGKWGGNI